MGPHSLLQRMFLALVTSVICVLPAFPQAERNYRQLMDAGFELSARDELDKAIIAFETSAELRPEAIEPRLWLIGLYIQTGRPENLKTASDECRNLLKRRPQDPRVHLLLGEVLRSQACYENDAQRIKAKLEEALSEVHAAESWGAPRALCENSMALILAQKGDLDVALQHVEAALRLQPSFPDAHLIHAVLKVKLIVESPLGRPGSIQLNSPEYASTIHQGLVEIDQCIEEK
jgi:tetratricopeptide (TPR) repeat protein